ncbi:hypothetical protein PV08_10049 [Exophiala spinifera]|uniref:Transcription factor domain-containing protein n=1 Tax=Exophiala spinifera TaxID=91928 RepID=A0A0D2AW76_9EURO|nr:uncharacterized protein PV08_10049 [Exophiala spinifera]KIW10750.1 hypothetical protein PV08_10049 [Exophiala spinifera]
MSYKRSSLAGKAYVASLVNYLDRDIDATVSAPERPQLSETAIVPDGSVNHKQYFAYSKGAYRYLGAQSLLLDLDALDDWVERAQTNSALDFPFHTNMDCAVISPDLHRYLSRHFTDSVQKMYPILNPSYRWLTSDDVVDLHSAPNEAFLQQMVYAISCRSNQNDTLFFHPLATVAHSKALQYFEKATADSSISTLQVAVLLVLYSLFDPLSGNLSQQVGFAARLAIELTGSEPDESSPMLSTLIKVTYCLENQACGFLDRPASMQEPGTPLTLSVTDPLDFLCTLYRIQARTRAGLLDDNLRNTLLLLDDDALERLHPNLLSTLRETQFMLHPTALAATELTTVYLNDRYIPTVLTPHWVFKAASVIVEAVPATQDASQSRLLQNYGHATALLGKWSARWDAARVLLQCLQLKVKGGM